ncbi:hypothetical protein B7Y94_02685 [Candidatus Saccharibacteria bacterium 32-49-12]|nr:MAG: hypothetical protein B7Y94_02685 [Candidatus Saccharibacteria bacterium 32-49-12]
MGASGYQKHIAYGIDGETAKQPLNINACWYMSCVDYNPSLSAGHIVYVIRGLGSSPKVASTYTPYGVQPGHNTTVAPAAQSLARRKLAIFSYVYYGNRAPTESDASTPSLNWTIDSTAPGPTQGNAVSARHTFAETTTNVVYQMTMPSEYSHYHGSVLFTIQ